MSNMDEINRALREQYAEWRVDHTEEGYADEERVVRRRDGLLKRLVQHVRRVRKTTG